MSYRPSLYFKDGAKSIDLVLVYKSTDIKTEIDLNKLGTYLTNLTNLGIFLETSKYSGNDDINFIKVHASTDTINYFADVYDIDLSYRCVDYRPPFDPPPHIMGTPVTLPNPNDYDYHRAPEHFSGDLPTELTQAEKIMVLAKVLSQLKFGKDLGHFGYEKLIRESILTAVFPLHEGPYVWAETGPLNERQILARFWATPRFWYKTQPLNLIEKYYGIEFAFYFAWLGFYIKLLIPAAILSVFCLIFGVATVYSNEFNSLSKLICNSKKVMCPRCHFKHCKYEYLNSSCVYSYVTHLFDNPATIAYAVFMSFWSTFFMEFWGRNEAFLQIRWNVKSLENDLKYRPQYHENTKYRMLSPVTGKIEPFVPKRIICCRYFVSFVSLLLLLITTALATFGVMVYRTSITLILIRDSKDDIILQSRTIIAASTGSFMSAVFICLFKLVYSKIALFLTDMENHRTQHEYDNSYVYKSYALAFTNNYSAVFYIAFFKGRFYTHPGDMRLWKQIGGIGSDICDPTGCIFDLGLQLLMILFMKIFVSNAVQILYPLFLIFINSCRSKNVGSVTVQPQIEQDYMLAPTERYFLVDEFMEMVIQYGFVTFFIAGFPIATILALLNNIIELRVDAIKLTRSFRRPIPNRVSGIGAWNGILQFMTYFGVTTNALVIAFTSEFVPKMLYRRDHDGRMRGYLNWTLSEYRLSDFKVSRASTNVTTCYYPGIRHPPEHTSQYHLTIDYWYVLALRFGTVVLFEHLVFLLAGILAYAIPDVPFSVKEQIQYREKENNSARVEALNREYMKGRKQAEQVNLEV